MCAALARRRSVACSSLSAPRTQLDGVGELTVRLNHEDRDQRVERGHRRNGQAHVGHERDGHRAVVVHRVVAEDQAEEHNDDREEGDKRLKIFE